MKVKTETALFQTPFGSKLYGTDGPTSDLDFKVVCLPAMDTLLLNYKVTNRTVKPEGVGSSGKMNAGEAEYEYIPLQIFLDDFFDGQTYALEIAFAVLQNKFMIDGRDAKEVYNDACQARDWTVMRDVERIVESVGDLVSMFLTSSVKKMVGYAVSQSKLYGLKTERYTSIKAAHDVFDKFIATCAAGVYLNKLALRDCPTLIEELLTLDHITKCEILNGAGGTEMSPALDICGKKHSYSNSVATIFKSLQGALGTYGERVKQFDGQGVDWKALSHAIRITEQVIELSTTGKFTFPRPNAEYLKQVKTGQISVDEATNFLTARFNEVDKAVEQSVLRERTPELEKEFEQFKLTLLKQYYE